MANLCGMCHLLLLREVTQNLRLLSWLRGKIDERPRCANTTAVLTTDTRWRREQWLTEQYPRRRKSAPAARPRSLRRRSFSIGISRNAAVLPLDVSPASERTALHGVKAIGTWREHARVNGQKITLSATRPTRRNGVNEIRSWCWLASVNGGERNLNASEPTGRKIGIQKSTEPPCAFLMPGIARDCAKDDGYTDWKIASGYLLGVARDVRSKNTIRNSKSPKPFPAACSRRFATEKMGHIGNRL